MLLAILGRVVASQQARRCSCLHKPWPEGNRWFPQCWESSADGGELTVHDALHLDRFSAKNACVKGDLGAEEVWR